MYLLSVGLNLTRSSRGLADDEESENDPVYSAINSEATSKFFPSQFKLARSEPLSRYSLSPREDEWSEKRTSPSYMKSRELTMNEASVRLRSPARSPSRSPTPSSFDPQARFLQPQRTTSISPAVLSLCLYHSSLRVFTECQSPLSASRLAGCCVPLLQSTPPLVLPSFFVFLTICTSVLILGWALTLTSVSLCRASQACPCLPYP